jgi:hypothetical protein
MESVLIVSACLIALSAAASANSTESPSGSWARYDLISTIERKAPPVEDITLNIGPVQKIGSKRYQWCEVAGNKPSGEHFAIRLLIERVPMTADKAPGTIKRYMLREGDDQPIEYTDARTGAPFLPKFEFITGLLPATEPYLKARRGSFACTGTYLGHVIALAEAGVNREWSTWPAPTTIKLNPDEQHYMYGLARDTEGRYVKEEEDRDYNYVALTHEELDQMIDLGMNSFDVGDEAEEWVCRRPVFYYKKFGPDTKLKYPEILYRSNFRGAVCFIDEPESRILADRRDLDRTKEPEQGGFTLAKRLDEIWNTPAPGEWRRGLLREQLRATGTNLGTLALNDNDHPIWVTIYETSFYQLQGGAAGVVHEGRYQLPEYLDRCRQLLGKPVDLTPREMLVMHYAFLRGAARAFGKSWGVSIYGQCDPEIAPEAITLAYDMGARYIWFWSYDHQHHLPHFMKLKLLKHLAEHKAKHPRGSIEKILNAPRTVIVLPYGYGYRVGSDRLWDSIYLDIDSKNDAGVPHRKVEAAAVALGIACAKAGEDFDFTVDIGQSFKGYNRVIKIGLDGQVVK